MSVDVIKNMGHSVNARLKHIASAQKVSFDYLLLRYAYERFLYRLGQSVHASRFVLKGASAFSVWFGPMFRVTRDTDLLCHGNPAPEHLIQCFRDICETEVHDDGIRFDASSITSSEIKKDAKYRGTRIMFNAWIHQAKAAMQFDIGFGDSVYPEAEFQEYPKILDDFEPPNILVYPRYTVVAEKLEAIVSLGMLNSRLKDYFDLWLLSERFDFDYLLLKQAIARTFQRRESELPKEVPIGLTSDFFLDAIKQSQWRAFLRKVAPEQRPDNLQSAVERIVAFLRPFMTSEIFLFERWKAGKRWMSPQEEWLEQGDE